MGTDAESRPGPSRPDRFGEPRPPAAPRSGSSYRHPVRVLHLDPHDPPRRWRRVGPHGRPPLEVVLVPARVRLAGAALESGLYALIGGAVLGWAAWTDWMPPWLAVVVWLGIVGLMVLWRSLDADVSPPVLAGADWVGRSTLWVPLYELTRLGADTARNQDGDELPGTVALSLWHGPDEAISLDMALLQSNPALWDLVYQGLLASIAAGAELTDNARQALRQP